MRISAGIAYLDCFRRDLAYAEEIGAKYVLFHVAEVTLRESYTYRYKYTNRQFIVDQGKLLGYV